MARKRLYNLILLSLLMCLLMGCTDYPPIDKHNFIIGILHDYKNNKYQGYYEVQNLQKPNSTENTSIKKTNKIVFSEADTWLESFVNFINSCDQRINGSTQQITIYTERYAKKEGAIEEQINHEYSSPYPRVNTISVIYSGEVEDILSIEPENESSVFSSIKSTIRQLSNARWEGGISVLKSDVRKWTLSKDLGILLPYVTASKKEQLTLTGYVILHQGKQIGTIPIDESRGLLYLLGKKSTLKYQITDLFDDKSTIQFTVSPKKPKIKVKFNNNNVSFDIKINANATFDYIAGKNNVDEKIKKEIIKILKERIEKEITETIVKSQKDFKVDFLKFNQYFNSKYRGKIPDEEWNNYYQNANISVDVNIILNSGKVETEIK